VAEKLTRVPLRFDPLQARVVLVVIQGVPGNTGGIQQRIQRKFAALVCVSPLRSPLVARPEEVALAPFPFLQRVHALLRRACVAPQRG
jgi:hypothetical protein